MLGPSCGFKAAPKAPAKKAPAKTVKKVAAPKKRVSSFKSSGNVDLSKWYGAGRKLYLPGGLLGRDELPAYLDGTLAGDYGFDPLGLSKSSADVLKYREYEIIHGRWAMLGWLGAIAPEALAKAGAPIEGAVWWQTGAVALGGGNLTYSAAPFGVFENPLPLVLFVPIQVALVGAVEKYRTEGAGPAGFAPGIGDFDESAFKGLDTINPGGPLDFFGFADDPEIFAELRVKEIKNARLAMVAMLGLAFQAIVTGEGPIQNWGDHLANPFGCNLFTVLSAGERVATL
mmetsp:Transcript_10242/g.37713  ORF Transcript_10242/g.37713 Transcript_10242/m.37713 type:complete len:286 (-) Transcript_10242:1807-2664(-)